MNLIGSSLDSRESRIDSPALYLLLPSAGKQYVGSEKGFGARTALGPNVPDDVLDPSSSWPDKTEYGRKYRQLAQRFIENFGKFTEGTPQEVIDAGPKV